MKRDANSIIIKSCLQFGNHVGIFFYLAQKLLQFGTVFGQ